MGKKIRPLLVKLESEGKNLKYLDMQGGRDRGKHIEGLILTGT